MDTKLKKYKRYSIKTKFAAIILIVLCTISSTISGLTLFNIGYDPYTLPNESFFDTEAFNNQYSQLIRDVVNINLAYINEENIKAGNALDEEKLLNNFSSDHGIPLKDVESFYNADKGNYSKFGYSKITEQSDKNSEYYEIYEKYFSTYKKRVIQDQLSDFRNSKSEIESFGNFMYCLTNDVTGVEKGNSNQEDILSQKITTTVDGPYVEGYFFVNSNQYYYYDNQGNLIEQYYYDNYQKNVETILQDKKYTLTVGISDELNVNDKFYSQYNSFMTRKNIVPFIIVAGISSAVIVVLLFIYLILVAGRTEKGGTITLKSVDRIYNDIHIFLVFVSALASMLIGFILIRELYYLRGETSVWMYTVESIMGILILTDVMIALSYIMSVSRQIKAKQLFKNMMISEIIRRVGALFSGKTFKGWIVFCMFIYTIMNIVIYELLRSSMLYSSTSIVMFIFAILLAFNILSAIIFVRALSSLTKIMIAVKETSKGNLSYSLNLDEISPSFINFATDVADMQIGLKKAVEEAVKGERMKTDLITNVSHDLKTPLTSIITYVDLLKKIPIDNETVNGYVNILDEKSNRLKQLIEDLIEASKASSGNLTVSKEKLDLRQLVMQASGEFEEKIKKAGLNFRISSSGETTICADGKHMWRIVENLISNAIKYSMPNSRVYIDIIKTEETGMMVMKNMSAQAIDISPEQLTERFIRGDESRTTEGSGLGLSIAKSLTALQGGTMDISIDGDLFKVSIKMPIWVDENIKKETETTVKTKDIIEGEGIEV